ncbi:MAG: hypothetical protein KKA84_01450 [Bacteroidetes bacterium]|nr:hypothetical protein [Bacteroidota bacterium]
MRIEEIEAMAPEEIITRVKDSFLPEYTSLNNFREKYFLMKNLKKNFPYVPESIIYMIIDRTAKKYDYKEHKEEFIEKFVKQIFPILSEKF